jgi:hypothetical protein
MATPFKTCSCCGRVWATRAAFMADPATVPIGYQAFFEELELGLFLFNHAACGTTMALQAGVFADLREGPVFVERLTGSGPCEGYCLQRNELRPCPNHCECAWVRDVLQTVRRWPKGASGLVAASATP